jgi:RNA polymerase sigma-70 factor (ECF subfamily)
MQTSMNDRPGPRELTVDDPAHERVVAADLTAVLRRDFILHRDFLWGLCYRMTGSAADADDLVQDTFERAARHAPPDTETSLRAWLSRVALNLSCDQLRRRKLQPYRGTWLPEPVPTDQLRANAPDSTRADARYELLESATLAFLCALEALSPKQRAVLLLRDVFDYSVRETAAALAQSEANVKTSLHRARHAMQAYDQQRCVPTPALHERTLRTLQRFLLALSTDNVRSIEALLREDVVAYNDAGDDYVAARKPVIGRQKVALFHRKITTLADFANKPARMGIADINGLPTLVSEYEPGRADFAPRQLLSIVVDADGCIQQVHGVLARNKLQRIAFDDLPRAPALQRMLLGWLRRAMTLLQSPAQRLSRHIQAHRR